MARKSVQSLRKRAEELPRIFVLLVGIFIGGIVGVLFAVAAFSAFLFQFLSALRDATLALATVTLAIATISLYRATSVLATSTRSLADLESKRDRRANLARRIQLGESLVRTRAELIFSYIRPETSEFSVDPEPASMTRQLRRLINVDEGRTNADTGQLLTLLDQLIGAMELLERGERALATSDEEVLEWIGIIQRALRAAVQRWSSQIQFLQE